MVRRQFQRAKPNLGRAQSKKEASDIEEDRADERKARKPEDSLSQHEDSDSQLLQKVSLKKNFFVSKLCLSVSWKRTFKK